MELIHWIVNGMATMIVSDENLNLQSGLDILPVGMLVIITRAVCKTRMPPLMACRNVTLTSELIDLKHQKQSSYEVSSL